MEAHVVNPVTIGLVAGAFTTFSSLPQIVSVLQKRSMKDISLASLCMCSFGIVLWLVYAIDIHAAPVIVWNLISLCLYLAQIILKLSMSPRNASLVVRAGLPQTALPPS
jgi:MtN3 and saliva related transmembrane protein